MNIRVAGGSVGVIGYFYWLAIRSGGILNSFIVSISLSHGFLMLHWMRWSVWYGKINGLHSPMTMHICRATQLSVIDRMKAVYNIKAIVV